MASLSLDGYGPEKLTDIKAIIDYIFNEQMESEWADKEKNQVLFWLVFLYFLLAIQLTTATFIFCPGAPIERCHPADVGRFPYHRATFVGGQSNPSRGLSRCGGALCGAEEKQGIRLQLVQVMTWQPNVLRFLLIQPSYRCSKNNSTSQLSYSLHLWCLNPAVVLKDVRHSSRSIIVTSGTLSPMSSYQTELDIDFKISLEANHVIPPSRVWIGSVSHGPNNVLLNGTFRSTGTFDYQV